MTQEVWTRSHSNREPGAEKAGGKGQKYYSEGNYPYTPNKSILHAGVLLSSDGKLIKVREHF